jgi:DNA-directed RNA polymerase subunit H (RpoH/RPB5)
MDQVVTVYNNLVKLLGYRGAELNGTPLNPTDLMNQLKTKEFVAIIGDRKNSADGRDDIHIIIAMVSPLSEYASKTSEFRRLIKAITPMLLQAPATSAAMAVTPASALNNIMIVSAEPVSTHIAKELMVLRSENPTTRFEAHDYNRFLIEAPAHVKVPRHEVVLKDEINTYCKEHFISPMQLPKIYYGDIQAIWLGLVPGDVVKIHRQSETACVAIAYRLCI